MARGGSPELLGRRAAPRREGRAFIHAQLQRLGRCTAGGRNERQLKVGRTGRPMIDRDAFFFVNEDAHEKK